MATRALIDALITDRLHNFRELAEAKGSMGDGLPEKRKPSVWPSAVGKMMNSTPSEDSNKGAFMREFFQEIGSIQATLKMGHDNVKEITGLIDEALQATTQQRDQAVSSKLTELVDKTSAQVGEIKEDIENLKARCQEEEENCTAAEVKIQSNMQKAVIKKHQQFLLDFQRAQTEFKHALEKRRDQEMQILMPELNEEERYEMIENGETPACVIAQKMAGAHALLLDETQRVLDKHRDILKLEQNIADLANIFQEMAVLVDAQGEMLDNIEMHIHKANETTTKAERELIKTRKYQHKHRKKLCCLSFVMMVIVLIILFPVILSK